MSKYLAHKIVDHDPVAGVTVTCVACGRRWTVPPTPVSAAAASKRVQCDCDLPPPGDLVRRRATRAPTALPGWYVTMETPSRDGSMVIENLSYAGLKLRPDTPPALQTGEALTVGFALWDAAQASMETCADPLRATVVHIATVRWQDAQGIGVQFRDPEAYAAALQTFFRRLPGGSGAYGGAGEQA